MAETAMDGAIPKPRTVTSRVPRVLFLALSFPDVAEDQNMYTDLARSLVDQGTDLRVLAPARSSGPGTRVEGDIVVTRVATGRLLNVSMVRKGLENLLLPLRYRRAVNRHLPDWRPDWIVTPTPPITLGPLVASLKRRWGAKAYVVLRDIFPQNAVDLGILRTGVRYRFFRRVERKLYESADAIGCMSPGNARYVLEHNPGLNPNRVKVLPNWIGREALDPGLDRQEARRRWAADDRDFLCVFGGNIGRPQRVDFLLDVAMAIREDERIRLIIVGDGTERRTAERTIQERGLRNVTLHQRLPRAAYQSLLAAADLGIVTLHEAFTIPNIPSRLLGYWAAGIPVLAATDAATDLDEAFLQKHGGGRWIAMGDVAGFADAITSMADQPQQTRAMGTRGRDAVSQFYVADVAAQRMLTSMAVQ